MSRLDYLRQRFFDDTATPAEREELYQLIKDIDPETSVFFKPLESELANEVEITSAERERLDRLYGKLERRIHDRNVREHQGALSARKTYRRKLFYRVRIAASLLILVLAGYGISVYQRDDISTESIAQEDFSPGTEKATLKLADGTSIALDGSASSIPRQGMAVVESASGKLSYVAQADARETVHNVITTPRGGQYQVTLADGSTVWLNAASSLRFPAVFSGNERLVELTGEAYFEIAKNEKMPFKIRISSGAVIEVLGTHFNVMAYDEEDAIKTTLLEGAVQIHLPSGDPGVILSPNQEARISKAGELIVVKEVNARNAIAWKDDRFIFRNASLAEIMRQVARWYDVEVFFQDDLRHLRFGGVVSRKENASAVLKMLELTGSVRFKASENKIIVTKPD